MQHKIKYYFKVEMTSFSFMSHEYLLVCFSSSLSQMHIFSDVLHKEHSSSTI